MKAVLIVLTIAFSVSAFANTNPFAMTTAAPMALSLYSISTSGNYHPKELAESALRDVQNLEAGVLSPALNQYIKGSLERHPDLSVEDAIDALVAHAQEVLAK